MKARPGNDGPAPMTGYPTRLLPALLALLVLVAAGPARAIEVIEVRSPGGLVAWLVEDHSNPIIAMNFSFEGGAALDPEDRGGLARMTAGLLDEGAGPYDSASFRQTIEDLSIGFGFSAGQDRFGGSVRTLTDNAEKAFELLRLALTEARFDDEPVERVRGQILAAIDRAEQNAGRIASRQWWSQAFPGHPYGRPARGTRESVAALDVADFRGFVARRLARDNLIVAVVGDMTPMDLGVLLDRVFGGLPAAAEPVTVVDTEPVFDGGTTVIARPVPQSRVIFGQAGIMRNDPDWYTAFVLNHILGGGGFTSRLMQEVREERGLAYSIGTGLSPMMHAAVMAGSVGTRNDAVAETVAITRAEWSRLRDAGVGDGEVSDAVTFLTGSFPLSLDSTGSIAGILVSLQVHDLGIDYLDRRDDLIGSVTTADVNRLARRLLDPDSLTFVVVGEPEGLDDARRVAAPGDQ